MRDVLWPDDGAIRLLNVQSENGIVLKRYNLGVKETQVLVMVELSGKAPGVKAPVFVIVLPYAKS